MCKVLQQSYNVVGGFNPSEKKKKKSQLGLLFPIYGKRTNVPNQQPAININQLSVSFTVIPSSHPGMRKS